MPDAADKPRYSLLGIYFSLTSTLLALAASVGVYTWVTWLMPQLLDAYQRAGFEIPPLTRRVAGWPDWAKIAAPLTVLSILVVLQWATRTARRSLLLSGLILLTAVLSIGTFALAGLLPILYLYQNV